jgi:hypothetical protein
MLNPDDAALAELDGRFDMIHSASFFHLFGWDDQLKVGERMVRFFRPGAQALVLGRQVGSETPPSLEEYRSSGEKRYHHNVDSMQRLWDVIGERTNTKWKASGKLTKVDFEDTERTIIRFAVVKLE